MKKINYYLIFIFYISVSCKSQISNYIPYELNLVKWETSQKQYLLPKYQMNIKTLRNYINNSFKKTNYQNESFKSIKKSILEYVSSNNKIKIINNCFYIVETFSDGSLQYFVLTNYNGGTRYKLERIEGKWSIKYKRKISFHDYEQNFENLSEIITCSEKSSNSLINIISKFSQEEVFTKVIDLRCVITQNGNH